MVPGNFHTILIQRRRNLKFSLELILRTRGKATAAGGNSLFWFDGNPNFLF